MTVGASTGPEVGMASRMQLPAARGPLGRALHADLLAGALNPTTLHLAEQVAATSSDPLADDDLQLSLAVCYELHYRGLAGVDDAWEWDPALLTLRAHLERAHTAALHELVGPLAVGELPVDRQLTALIAADDGPSLSAHLARHGSLEQWREYLTVRSVFHLKEGDPHTFAVPRLAGRPKSAMVEIQADEYGGGLLPRMHSEMYVVLLRDLGLDHRYGALWNAAPAIAFGWVNTMSLFGLHRRWRAAAVGHLTAVEMTSSEPSRRYSAGLRRLGFGAATRVFYDEHVEADAVHEQLAAVDMCGSLVAAEPELLPDLLFGAACSLALDGRIARHLLGSWEAGRSGLHEQPAHAA